MRHTAVVGKHKERYSRVKPYGKNGRQINCCPVHDSTSKLMSARHLSKRARRQAKELLLSYVNDQEYRVEKSRR